MDSKKRKSIIEELKAVAEANPMKKPWTDDEVEIVKMFYGKVPVNVIAQKLGRSHNSVGDLIVRRNLKPKYDKE